MKQIKDLYVRVKTVEFFFTPKCIHLFYINGKVIIQYDRDGKIEGIFYGKIFANMYIWDKEKENGMSWDVGRCSFSVQLKTSDLKT